MDRNSFWREVIEIVKHHKRSPDPLEHLSEQRMAQLESNIFAHIEQQFPKDSTAAVKSDNATAPEPRKMSVLERVKSLLRLPFPDQFAGSPVLAFATFALLSAGVLTFILANNRTAETHFQIPESVASADLEQYIESPENRNRALVATLPSSRRNAFLTGVTLADLDVIGDSNKKSAQDIAIWFNQITKSVPSVDATIALDNVQSQATHFSSDEKSSFWFKQGYSIEMVHLAARYSLDNLNTSTLADALTFYTKQSAHPIPKYHTVDLSKQYIQNHEQLINAASTELSTPGKIQEIVKVTNNMKILIQ